MRIIMAGVDFYTAPLAVRERFSFTGRQAADAMQAALKTPGVQGCVFLCTCNRTELWISSKKDARIHTPRLLCALKGLPYSEYKDFIVQREEEDAALHLFETAAGLHSMLKWEDRILGQVKEALKAARDAQTTDETLDRIFQSAIAAAKRVKTQVKPLVGAADATHCITEKIHESMPDLNGVRCLVIGNGEMGRSAARALALLGSDVAITVRTYRRGLSLVPEHCEPVEYDGRMKEVKKAAIVIGATRSPHFTLDAQAVRGILEDGRERLFFDLACPRDFDPNIATIGNTKLFNIEDISAGVTGGLDGGAEQAAGQILRRELAQFAVWRAKRESIPLVQEAADTAADKIIRRMQGALAGLRMDPQTQEMVERVVQEASGRVLLSMLFELEERIGPEFAQGLEAYIAEQYPQKRLGGGGCDA